MKRNLILIAVLILTAFLIAGCKKTDKDDSAAAAGDVTTEDTAAEDTSDTGKDDSAASVTKAPTAAPTTAPTAAAEAVADTGSDTATYKDGVYEVKTDPDYEKYYTEATLTVEGGKITAVDWTIYDAGKDNAPFDSEYYKLLAPYGALYEQQGKDDWAGSRGYADALIESQDVDQVDAVSGATWTNKKFKEIVKLALEQAKK